jgi:hypothetical protein
MINDLLTLNDGRRVRIKITKTKCVNGYTICHQMIEANGKALDVNCTGACAGQTISWTCPDGKDCFLDCSTMTGSCS